MAPNTGQSRRRKTGTEAASRKKSTAQSRGSGGSSRQRSGSNSNGRAQASSRGTAKRTSSASKNGSSAAKNGPSAPKAAANKTSTAAKKTSTAVAKKTSSAARKTSSATAKKASDSAKETKSVARATKRRTKRAVRVVKAGWKVGEAVAPVAKAAVPVVKQLPGIVNRVRTVAVPAGATGGGLAATGLAIHLLRRRRQPAPLPRRVASKALSGMKNLRPRRRRRRLPQLPSLPHLQLPSLPDAPDLSDAAELLEGRPEALWLAAVPVGIEATRRAGRARHIPVMACVDVAVPLQVAYDEWMKLESLPEGAHRVEEIERDGDDRLTGRVSGPIRKRKWEAEIRDERDCESFAWKSDKGSDCAGLITFHSLGERLTRLELQLDIVPTRPLESVEFALHVADLHTRNELRRFKSRLEVISPDAYDQG